MKIKLNKPLTDIECKNLVSFVIVEYWRTVCVYNCITVVYNRIIRDTESVSPKGIINMMNLVKAVDKILEKREFAPKKDIFSLDFIHVDTEKKECGIVLNGFTTIYCDQATYAKHNAITHTDNNVTLWLNNNLVTVLEIGKMNVTITETNSKYVHVSII